MIAFRGSVTRELQPASTGSAGTGMPREAGRTAAKVPLDESGTRPQLIVESGLYRGRGCPDTAARARKGWDSWPASRNFGPEACWAASSRVLRCSFAGEGMPKPDVTAQAGLYDAQAAAEAACAPGDASRDNDSPSPDGNSRQTKRRPNREQVRGIQDLLWHEGLVALQAIRLFDDEEELRKHLHQHLPQNSDSTRSRYAQSLFRWFFPDGVRGLAARTWLKYAEPALAEEVLRYLYLRAEPMVGRVVSEALFPIAENSVIPGSYLDNFIRSSFGPATPDKSIKRVKANLRKLGFLTRERGNRDTLRAMTPSSTGFLIILHYLFANNHAHSVEVRHIAQDPFWKYLGFKSEDQFRAILKESLLRGILSKYVVADRIESITFRHSYDDFVERGLRL